MKIDVDISKMSINAMQLKQRYKENVAKAVQGAAEVIKGEMQESIQRGKKTGRIYRRGNRVHQASAAGEAPASDTGRLVSSLGIRREDEGLTAFVGTNSGVSVKYAKHLEFGTAHISPRPFARPALRKHEAAVRAYIEKAITKTNQEMKKL